MLRYALIAFFFTLSKWLARDVIASDSWPFLLVLAEKTNKYIWWGQSYSREGTHLTARTMAADVTSMEALY